MPGKDTVMINLEHLLQFITVVEHMNFTKAAEYLFISHSTVSRSMASLEAELGVRLFIRDNRAVTLTAPGRVLAERAKQLLAGVTEMEEDVKRAAQDVEVLKVTTINFYSQDVFSAFRQFSDEWPEYDLAIYHEPVDVILSQVSSRSTDIGILFDFALDGDMSEFEVYPILSGEFCVVVPEGHPLAGLSSIDGHDPRLSAPLTLGKLDYDFVRSIGKGFEPLSRNVVQPKSPLTLDSLILQIKSGKGIALLPQHVATEVINGCSIMKLTGVDSTYKIVMCWRRRNDNKAIPLFLDYFKALKNI